ncbi:MAG: hypothetical protein Q9219_002720 [cf. Caloplaca sp. 3 TL-2023]
MIDVESLSSYLAHSVPSIKLPIQIKQARGHADFHFSGSLTDLPLQFGFGQSNPTYQLIAADDQKYVLRKKPPGRLLSKTAHQVEREYRIIHALERTDVPVPRTYSLCEDPDILGTSFYIMEFLDGRIFEDASLPSVTAGERHEMWHDAIRVLAKLHQLSPVKTGLSNFGKSSGFYNRQLKTLTAISRLQAEAVDVESKVAVGKIPYFDDMVAFFRDPATQPKDRATLIHGDYKIDNLVYHKTEPRVIGILDWEMSTVGHPLSDLSNLLSPYVLARQSLSKALTSRTNPAFCTSANTPGLPTHTQCTGWYAKLAGWDPNLEIGWGDAFGVFRNSVIMQGIAARYATRQASSARAGEYAVQMKPFGAFAWALIQSLREKLSPGQAKL